MKHNEEGSKEVIDSVVLEVSKIVSHMAGIQLGPKQSAMVENRLKARMVRLGIADFSGYLRHLKLNTENESQALLSLMTTHHTYFFREFSHFEFLLNKGVDRLIDLARNRGDKKIRVWSAAASKGQEVYSLAMFFNYHLKQSAPDVDFEIWGTDIDPESINHAKNGVYKAEELKQSPAMYINGNWIRGKNNVKDFSKVENHLKVKCKFETCNLLKNDNFLNGKTFDLIFCRNVFIYFNQDQIKACAQSFLKHLSPQGFLFLGVSESLSGLGLAVDTIGPSTYQHKAAAAQVAIKHIPKVVAPAVAVKSGPVEVLCVDDSKPILALLKKILTVENGFVVKATAANGREAVELLKKEKFDAITLDLHMPELDGMGFLAETKSSDRPPVIILSAINRDDTTIAQKALDLGALDYVEKPSLENIAQAGNEIRAKLKMAMSAAKPTGQTNPSVSTQDTKKKKVLIVDDSKTIRQLLHKIISQDSKLEVVAQAEKPSEVEALILQHKPDVITLDIHMPEMDGVTLLKKLHPKYKIPTVMISSVSKEEGPQVLQALEAGAIDYIQKPQMSDLTEASQHIRDRIRIASLAKIQKKNSTKRVHVSSAISSKSLVVLGSSTGGTEAIREILQAMPTQIPPILIVQHIPQVFSAAFAKRLNDLCPFEVKEAEHGDEVKPNRVIIAAGGKQMGVKALKDKLVVTVTEDAPVNRHKPSVDYLFQSVANLNLTKVIGVILTGMGADGAKMLKRLRDQKARTIAQNEATCVVYGMPKEAVQLGAAEFVLPLEQIAQKVMDISVEQSKPSSSEIKNKKAA